MSNHKNSRRSFLQKSVLSTVGVWAAPAVFGNESPRFSPTVSQAAITPEWRNKQASMQYRMLGRTGMMVSAISMGTFPFTDETVYPVLDAALERGVNYFDTAAAYSQGKVESNLGNYFKKTGNRERLFLTTKLSGYNKNGYLRRIFEGLPKAKQESLRKDADDLLKQRMVLHPGYHFNFFNGQENQLKQGYLWHLVAKEYSLKEEWVREIKSHAQKLLETSLQRLQTDYVDVLFCPHGASGPELEDELIKELFADWKQKGLIRAAAVSFHNDVAGNLSQATELGYYDVAMFAYNIANHAALDALLYEAREAGLGLVAMKLSRLFVMNNQPEWIEKKLELIYPDLELSKFAKSYLWALNNPNLSSCVSQMDTIEKLRENTGVVELLT